MKTFSKKMKTLRVFKVREGKNSYSIEFVRLFDSELDSFVYAVYVIWSGQTKLYAINPDYSIVRNFFIRVITANNPIL